MSIHPDLAQQLLDAVLRKFANSTFGKQAVIAVDAPAARVGGRRSEVGGRRSDGG